MPEHGARLPLGLLLLTLLIMEVRGQFRMSDITRQVLHRQVRPRDQNLAGASSSNVFAGAVASVDARGMLNAATLAAGARNPELNDPMFADNSMRANQLGELVLAVVAMQLIDQQLLPTLDSSIPSSLFPHGVTLINPGFRGSPLTLRHLLLHTSSLRDNDRFVQPPVISGSGNSVPTLAAFCQDYFVTSDGPGRFAAQTDIWETAFGPGPTNFSYAKANVALLSFMVETALRSDPTKVRSVANPLAAYIEESIFTANGMTGTYFLNRDGSVKSVEGGFQVLSARKVAETTSNMVTTDTVPIRAPFLVDAMLITSAADMARLAAQLFINTASPLFRIGQMLRTQMIPIQDSNRPGVTQQGFGIVGFNHEAVCSAVSRASDFTEAGCSLTPNRALFGLISVGDQTAMSVLCTTAPLVVGRTGDMVCVATAHAFFPITTQQPSLSYALAGAAFNNLFLEPALFEGDTFDERRMSRGGWFAFTAFLGLFGATTFVLLFAYFAEYFVHPAPLAGSIATDAYPRLEDVVSKSSPFRDR